MSATIVSGSTITTIHSWRPRTQIRSLGQRQRVLFSSEKSCFRETTIRSFTRKANFTRMQAENGDGGIRAFEQEVLINGFSNLAPNGFQATLNNLSKWLVTALFGVLLLWRHDAEALWAAAGSVINAGLSTVMKRVLNQERPVANLRSDPGMPSSHAQAISYTVIFAIVSLVQWLGLNAFTAALSGLFVAVGSYFSWLRVSQQLHTISQVVVGALVGTIFSVWWFWSWHFIVLKAFESYLWVRIVVLLGAAAFCVAFLLYVLRYWVMETVTLYLARKS